MTKMKPTIIIEGADSTGKTTLLIELCTWLQDEQIAFMVSKNSPNLLGEYAAAAELLKKEMGADNEKARQSALTFLYESAAFKGLNPDKQTHAVAYELLRKQCGYRLPPAPDNPQVVLIDRTHFISNPVYTKSIRNTTNTLVNYPTLDAFQPWIQSPQVLFIHCDCETDIDKLKSDRHMAGVMDNIDKIKKEYINIFKEIEERGGQVINYDFNNGDDMTLAKVEYFIMKHKST